MLKNISKIGLILFFGLISTTQAAVLNIVDGSNITLNFLVIEDIPTSIDVRGNGFLIQEGTGAEIILTDFGTPSDPNLTMGASSNDFSEVLLVTFDPTSLTFGPGFLSAFLVGSGTSFIGPATPTNTGLQDLLGNNTYAFVNPRSTPIVLGSETYLLVSYDLESILDNSEITVPEPSTVLSVGFAGLLMFLSKKYSQG
jgi:hypothetical protein